MCWSVHLHAWVCVYEPASVQGDSKLAKYGSRGSGFLAELIMENGEFHLQVSDWIWSSLSLSALYDYLADRSWDLGHSPKISLVSKCSPSLLLAQFYGILLGLILSSPTPTPKSSLINWKWKVNSHWPHFLSYKKRERIKSKWYRNTGLNVISVYSNIVTFIIIK